jgi:hypothetical protein
MSTTSISSQECGAQAHRPVVDVVAERMAQSLLSWTNSRAERSELSHERVALIRANTTHTATGGGSALWR